jgi:HSP20 family molecular chaperone IbpA
MGSKKMNLYTASKGFHQTIDNMYRVAFGPSQALYRQISLCGWRLMGFVSRPTACLANSTHMFDQERARVPSIGIEIYETMDAMTIEVALNCVKEESLHLSISGQTLIIRGERIMSAKRGKSRSNPLARQARFQRLIPLPATVKAGGFRAQLKGDVVQIDFAKRRMR